MVSIKELQKSIAIEREKVRKAQEIEAGEIERSKLKKELFQLKHKKALATSGKGIRLLRKAGKGIISAGKKAAPVILKQGKLIRQQQLRDDAIARKLAKKKKSKPKKKSQGFNPLEDFGF